MDLTVLAARLAMRPNAAMIVVVFFIYSFLGNIMECVVLSVEKRQPVLNRGFTAHLPFSIIYGAGAMIGFIVLSPLYNKPLLLYLVGAVLATGFEYLVGRTQLKLFGELWWDYTHKPFNFQGIICLESTVFWGLVAFVIIRYLHFYIVDMVSRLPSQLISGAAVALLGAYVLDFLYSARVARLAKQTQARQAENEYAQKSGWNHSL